MEKSAAINFFNHVYKSTIEFLDNQKKEIYKNEALTEETKAYDFGLYLSYYDTLLTGYDIEKNIFENSIACKPHPIKERIISIYKKNKDRYIDTPYFFFIKDIYLPIIREEFSNQLDKIRSESKDDFSIKDEEVLTLLAQSSAYQDYKKEYYKHKEKEISKYLNHIENNEASASIERIEWLGDQKQLSELMIELYYKGWIKYIPTVKTMKSCFTKTDSIQAYLLQPLDDKRKVLDKQSRYMDVYSKRYKPKFESILSNDKPTENQE